MKFTVNDKTYFVKWEYPDITTNIPVHTFTVCKIYDNTTSYSEPLIEAGARLAEGDRFCKNTGRKISLARALNKLFPYRTVFEGYPKGDGSGEYEWIRSNSKGEMKQAREIAWQEYFKESPKRLK